MEYDEKRMLHLVPTFLGGVAATWYDCETENDTRPFPSWEIFTKSIIGQLNSVSLHDVQKK